MYLQYFKNTENTVFEKQ